MRITRTSTRTVGETAMAWARRAVTAGFTFFLIKGLAWLAVPFIAARLW